MFQIEGETFDEKLASVADLISAKKHIVVLAGAGISVSVGIPDFRSKDGLYNNLNYHELGLTCAEDLFDLEAFSADPRPFWKFVRTNGFVSLFPGKIQPSISHRFLAWLDEQNKLLRIYTQNIDGLEEAAGVTNEKVVYAHGSFTGATCLKCRAKYNSTDIASGVQNQETIPVCHRRIAKKAKTTTKIKPIEIPAERKSSRKRSCTNNNMPNEFHPPPVEPGCCGGIIKPNITFFGEKLENTISRKLEEDYKKVDALIVMGTSLSVAPMSNVVDFLPDNIPRILINRDIVRVKIGSQTNGTDANNFCLWDVCLLGNCDAVTKAIVEGCSYRLGRLVTDDNGMCLKNQPREGILLFEGATLSAVNGEEGASSQNNNNILVHCDNCGNEIKDNIIYSCNSCFDYDLCGQCYPKIKQKHADGQHEFEIQDN